MKKLRKFVAVLLALSMSAVSSMPAFAAEDVKRDVPDLLTTTQKQIESIERIGTPDCNHQCSPLCTNWTPYMVCSIYCKANLSLYKWDNSIYIQPC